VLPSITEPFGLTPLESIGYGTPALISKQSGVSEVLNNALKVDYWDIDEMANQIASVLMNDPLRDELEANSYRELEQMSWQQSTDKLMGIYSNHLAGADA
jgi:glycosyltransferase involved in cell wall biosynthesis